MRRHFGTTLRVSIHGFLSVSKGSESLAIARAIRQEPLHTIERRTPSNDATQFG
jgi:hypothetical protein